MKNGDSIISTTSMCSIELMYMSRLSTIIDIMEGRSRGGGGERCSHPNLILMIIWPERRGGGGGRGSSVGRARDSW